ncbi:MAG: aminopeptidase P family protein [Chloroflexi bacterium]|nr:aminopeptidase P family protein [Chloroflexota bacterium]
MTSTDLEYAMFSRAEMERRYNRARELMAEKQLDALLITGDHNFHYFAAAAASIGPNNSLSRPSLFILPVGRDPIIVTQGRDNLVLGCYVTDLREYSGVLSVPVDLVVESLREAGLKNKRVGAELGQEQRMGIPVGVYLDLVAAMPEVEFVDAADIIIKTRMVKSQEELAYMRKAAEITARARQRLFDNHLAPGMTEREVARLMQQLMLEEGADGTSFVHFQFDIQSQLPGAKTAFHYERPLRKGTILGIDTGAYVGMYTVDYPRMVALGKATDEQKRLYEALLKVNSRMAEALRPGVSVSEIHRVGARAIEEVGVEPDNPQRLLGGSRMGHGQGIQFTEPPSITPDDHTVLEVGMVISTEPGVGSGDLKLLWEDTHAITEDGHELLTLETDELREIPF